MGKEPPDKKLLSWDLALKVAASIATGALGILWGMGHNWVYVTISVAFIVIPPIAFLAGRYVKRESNVILEDGRHAKLPVVSEQFRKAAWLLPALSLCQLSVVYLFFWESLFPVIYLGNYEGSPLVWSGDNFTLRKPIATVLLSNGTVADGFPALSIDAYKSYWMEKARILKVRVIAMKTDYQFRIAPQVGPQPMKAITYRAVIPNEGGKVVADLHENDKIIDATVSLDKDNSFCTLHIDVYGKPDNDTVFSVNVEVDIEDQAGGRKKTLKTNKAILVYLHGKWLD